MANVRGTRRQALHSLRFADNMVGCGCRKSGGEMTRIEPSSSSHGIEWLAVMPRCDTHAVGGGVFLHRQNHFLRSYPTRLDLVGEQLSRSLRLNKLAYILRSCPWMWICPVASESMHAFACSNDGDGDPRCSLPWMTRKPHGRAGRVRINLRGRSLPCWVWSIGREHRIIVPHP